MLHMEEKSTCESSSELDWKRIKRAMLHKCGLSPIAKVMADLTGLCL